MITFVDIDKDNWNVWGGLVERSEIIFPDQLRSCSAEYSEILRMKRSIAKIAMLGSEYIGNIIGCRMSAKDLDEGHTEDLDKSIMLCNFVIDPKHHGRGYGSVMLIDFIRSAMQAGYTNLFGYFNPKASLGIIKRFGAEEVRVEKNWFETGEDYIFCKLEFDRMVLPESMVSKANFNQAIVKMNNAVI